MSQTRSGGFDRRTLLAFALMILIWIVFTQFFMPKPRRGEQAGGAPVDSVAAGAASLEGAPDPRPVSGETGAPAGPERSPGVTSAQGLSAGGWWLENELQAGEELVVVEGERYRAVFDPRGAQLRSWQLKGFTDATGETVDLVSSGGPGALGLQVAGPSGAVWFEETLFRLEPEAGQGASERLLRFVAEGPLVPAGDAGPAGGAADSTRVRVERIYRLDLSRYDFGMEVVVQGIANPRQDQRLVLSWEEGIPNLETQHDLELRSKAAVVQLAESYIKDGYGGSGLGCQCGGGRASQGGERPYQGMLRWTGVRGKYFAGLIIPTEEQEATVVASSDPGAGMVGLRLEQPLAFDGRSVRGYRVFAGPIDYRILRDLEEREGRGLTRLVDFGGKLIAPISKATHWFLVTVERVVPNYGLVIILLAVVVRLIFHPLNVKALESQRKLQALKPLLDDINRKYKDNAELRTKKTMELHKHHGVNPLGGCLPLLVQMPVIYALYNVLMNAIELRKAPFAFWMNDLSAPDTVGHLVGIPINILPLLMAGTMFWQQKLTPTDPRQAPMLVLMPLMMVFFFYGLPSGLVLYWTVTNVLAVIQQMRMKPLVLAAPDAGAEERPETTRFGRKRATQG